MRLQVVENFDRVQARSGIAADIVGRLDGDVGAILSLAPSDTGKANLLASQIGLDLSLARQLLDAHANVPGNAVVPGATLSGATAPGATAPGVYERLFPAGVDRKIQPLAVYLPRGYDPRTPHPLVLLLHGADQLETQLIVSPVLQGLADDVGAVLAAPWARGDYTDPRSTGDIYDALRFMQSAYPIDPRRIYCVGYSAGGFASFVVTVAHPDRWAAIMSIAGSLTNEDKQAFANALHVTPVYLVTGSGDTVVPAKYVQESRDFLTDNGLTVRYYEQPGGTHVLGSLAPALTRAWHDMFAGAANVAPQVVLPSPQPSNSLRS
jgi:acetyl esterase/lipase